VLSCSRTELMNSQEHPGDWKTSQEAARGQPIDLFPEMPSTDEESTCLEKPAAITHLRAWNLPRVPHEAQTCANTDGLRDSPP
jgi:hypothetical protein